MSSPPAKPKSDDKDKDKKPVDSSDDSLSLSSSVSPSAITLVVVHPLVLLSVIDHYSRVAKDTQKRVVGVLLGELFNGKAEITNSYAVPFEEDPKDPSSWYLDRQYHEEMFAMFKKVNASERVLGWYSTGPKLKSVDLSIHETLRSYTSQPILVLIAVGDQVDHQEIPTTAYLSVESVPLEQHSARRQFAHLPSQIGANEAEEVGVEHLLRNLRDFTSSSLTERVKTKISSLETLRTRLKECENYLGQVLDGKLPVNLSILAKIQDMFNLMPDLSDPKLISAITLQSNDQGMLIYISSLVRSIIAIHDLIINKQQNKRILIEKEKNEAEAAAEAEEKEKEEKEKERVTKASASSVTEEMKEQKEDTEEKKS